MGYVFDFKDALAYQQWLRFPKNQVAVEFEKHLMLKLLRPTRGETVLDIGCGTGQGLVPLMEKGLQVTGLDASPYMLDMAIQNVGHQADLYRGVAEDLPFDDNSFNHAVLMWTLEFVDDPRKSLEEACRVAKDRVYIGAINRYAFKFLELRLQGFFSESLFNHARFFSVWKLKKLAREVLGDVPISWRTVCHFSTPRGKISNRIEHFSLLQRFPFGAYTGMVLTLVPRFRTRPLLLPCHSKQSTGVMVS